MDSSYLQPTAKEHVVKQPIEAATSVPCNSSSIATAADTTGQQQKHTSDLGDLGDLGEGDGCLLACSCTNHQMSTICTAAPHQQDGSGVSEFCLKLVAL